MTGGAPERARGSRCTGRRMIHVNTRQVPAGRHGRRFGGVAVCLVVLVAMAAGLIGGCRGLSAGDGAGVTIQSVGMEPVELAGAFDTRVYTVIDDTETAFLLTDIDPDRLMEGDPGVGQVLYVEMLWKPRPGSTPLDASATNVSVTYIIFSNGEMGVYTGGGFAMPSGRSGRDGKTLSFRDATLRLDEATDGFVDLLSPARLEGTIVADHDERATRRLRFALSQIMTNRLGETRLIGRANETEERYAGRTGRLSVWPGASAGVWSFAPVQ